MNRRHENAAGSQESCVMKMRESYCTFRVDELLFGVEVLQVQEVIRAQHITRVPLAPGVVHGLMNLRGQIVSALNLRERLGLPKARGVEPAMNVVIRSTDEPVSLLVDRIGDVVEVEESRFEEPPETVGGPQRELIKGALKLKDELLLILNTDRVLEVAA